MYVNFFDNIYEENEFWQLLHSSGGGAAGALVLGWSSGATT